MADRTAIEWTDATWNPIVGCKVLSPGCAHCYAMSLAGGRLKNHPTRAGLTTMTSAGPVWNGEVRFNAAELVKPLAWRRPRKIFVCAHADLFYEGVPDEWIDRVWRVMTMSPRHTYQVLTKRPARMRQYLLARAERLRREGYDADALRAEGLHEPLITALSGSQPLPNVWLGVSAEDQQRADERIPELLLTPAAVHFVSIEPMLAPIQLQNLRLSDLHKMRSLDGSVWKGSFWTEDRKSLDWVIVGGESGGRKARPMHPNWVRLIRDDCAAFGVAFFFKQWGENAWCERIEGDPSTLTSYRAGKRFAGHVLDGQVYHEFPTAFARAA